MNDMVDNSLKAGQYLLDVLNDNDELTEALGGDNKIWPLVAKEGTQFPFVIYTRDQVSVQYTKFPGHDNTLIISYRVYSDSYDEALNIVNIIRNILERRNIKFENDIRINDIRVASVGEYFSEDGFCEMISFQTQVE